MLRALPIKSLVICASICVLTACGGSATGATESGGSTAAQYEGPVGSTDTAAGETAFNNLCAGCHPGGEAGVGPTMVDIAWPAAKVRQQIREGSGSMPPFDESQLSGEDLEAVLAYVQTLGTLK